MCAHSEPVVTKGPRRVGQTGLRKADLICFDGRGEPANGRRVAGSKKDTSEVGNLYVMEKWDVG